MGKVMGTYLPETSSHSGGAGAVGPDSKKLLLAKT